jgi:hypothetical protein
MRERERERDEEQGHIKGPMRIKGLNEIFSILMNSEFYDQRE